MTCLDGTQCQPFALLPRCSTVRTGQQFTSRAPGDHVRNISTSERNCRSWEDFGLGVRRERGQSHAAALDWSPHVNIVATSISELGQKSLRESAYSTQLRSWRQPLGR